MKSMDFAGLLDEQNLNPIRSTRPLPADTHSLSLSPHPLLSLGPAAAGRLGCGAAGGGRAPGRGERARAMGADRYVIF